MVPNRPFWNGAVIAAIETVDIERGDGPHGSRFNFVGAIGPRVEGTLQVVSESSCAVGKRSSIDSNSICAHLHQVARKCNGGFEKRRSAIRASPRSAILTAEGNGGRCSLRAKLHEVCAGRFAGDVKAPRQRGGEINADAENPARNESEKEGRGQQAGPEDGVAESLA